MHASDGALRGVRAEATALTGRGQLAAPRLYRVEYLDVKTPSSVEGRAGPWPDALVPDVDAFAGEKRRAFPFDVPAGESRAVWVELFVPESAAPGGYRGSVRMSADGQRADDDPDRARGAQVRAAEVVVAAGDVRLLRRRGRQGASRAVAASDGAPGRRATRCRSCAIASACTAARIEPAPWKSARRQAHRRLARPTTPRWRRSSTAPPIAAARPTARAGRAFDFRVPQKLHGAERADYARTARRAPARARLARSRLRLHVRRAARRRSSTRCAAAPPSCTRAAPVVPRLVTHALDARRCAAPSTSGARWSTTSTTSRATRARRRAPPTTSTLAHGERLWWYQACMSHGCNIVGGDYFTRLAELRRRRAGDEPSHLRVAHLPLPHRRRALLQHRRGLRARARIRGRDQLLFGGNGDGTLFYPGRARTIGGTRDIPVESVRLALIREGLEDYEYLRLYAQGRRRKRGAGAGGDDRGQDLSLGARPGAALRRAPQDGRGDRSRRLRRAAESALLLAECGRLSFACAAPVARRLRVVGVAAALRLVVRRRRRRGRSSSTIARAAPSCWIDGRPRDDGCDRVRTQIRCELRGLFPGGPHLRAAHRRRGLAALGARSARPGATSMALVRVRNEDEAEAAAKAGADGVIIVGGDWKPIVDVAHKAGVRALVVGRRRRHRMGRRRRRRRRRHPARAARALSRGARASRGRRRPRAPTRRARCSSAGQRHRHRRRLRRAPRAQAAPRLLLSVSVQRLRSGAQRFFRPNSARRSSRTRRLVPRRRAISSFGRSPHAASARTRSCRSSSLVTDAEARPAVLHDRADERLQARRRQRARRRRQRQIGGQDLVAVGEHGGALDQVLQLAHVAGEGVGRRARRAPPATGASCGTPSSAAFSARNSSHRSGRSPVRSRSGGGVTSTTLRR